MFQNLTEHNVRVLSLCSRQTLRCLVPEQGFVCVSYLTSSADTGKNVALGRIPCHLSSSSSRDPTSVLIAPI